MFTNVLFSFEVFINTFTIFRETVLEDVGVNDLLSVWLLLVDTDVVVLIPDVLSCVDFEGDSDDPVILLPRFVVFFRNVEVPGLLPLLLVS